MSSRFDHIRGASDDTGRRYLVHCACDEGNGLEPEHEVISPFDPPHRCGVCGDIIAPRGDG